MALLPILSRTSLGGLVVLTSCGPEAPAETETSPPETSSSTGPTATDATLGADEEPPKLLFAALRDPSTLELTFTEPLSGTVDVTPGAFRLSAAFHTLSATTQGTQYFDPSRWNCNYDHKPCGGEEPCYDVCYPSEERSLDILDVVPDPEEPSRVLLVLENPILFLTCWTIGWKASTPEVLEGGLFLHYLSKGALVDGSGNELASIGASWVEAGADYLLLEDQAFPELDPFLPIPCTATP